MSKSDDRGAVCIYLNRPNSKAQIIESKLEIGKLPSLF